MIGNGVQWPNIRENETISMSEPDRARVTVETIAYPSDDRGLVVEPLRAEEFPAQRNAHLVITRPGGVRGNHYHRVGSEVALVLGPALVRYRDGDAVVDRPVAPGEAVRFSFPAGIAHAIKNTGDTPGIALSFNTEVHDRAHPDVVRDVLIES
jgi:dTDP-4-dehydrorhamnose 3,5-epimerase-like enzyme